MHDFSQLSSRFVPETAQMMRSQNGAYLAENKAFTPPPPQV